MALVNLTNITVLDNPSVFTNPFQFEVTFECLQQLEDDLEWKITYVGSAENDTLDQVLEEVLVGPVPVGMNKFVFQAEPPNLDLIPEEDKIGVTVVLITCSYREQEFVRVGYYVNILYADPELVENPPPKVDISKLQRNILADKPRVTRFPINWHPSAASGEPNDSTMVDGGANNESCFENDENMMMDDDQLIKAAAQLDAEVSDLVIGGENDADLFPEEDDEDDEDDDEMDMDEGNDEIDLDSAS